MMRNYPEVLNDSKKTMTVFPESFEFDRRIDQHNTVVLPVLEQIKKEMDETHADFTKIKKFIEKIKPQLAEGDIFDPLIRFFYNNRGLFLHSLKMDQYLKSFSKLAQEYRRNNTSASPQLTALEEKLKTAFSIEDNDLDAPANKVLADLNQQGHKGTFLGVDVKISIESTFVNKWKAFKTKSKQAFQDGSKYTTDEVKDKLKLIKFHHELNYPGEQDFCCIIADLRLFVSIEVKCHMKENLNGSPKTSKSTIDGNLRSAAEQLRKNSSYTSRLHGPILSKGWGFLKIAAIMPHVINKQAVCPHCNRFILTEDILTTPGGIEKWFQETGILEHVGKINQQMKDQGFEDMLKIFNRLVNLSNIGIQPANMPQAWQKITGKDDNYITAGYTATPQGSKSEELNFDEVLNRPHDAFKILYFNRDQYQLLTTKDLFRLIFLCDYGAGKYKLINLLTRYFISYI